jgi:hypothetical protein
MEAATGGSSRATRPIRSSETAGKKDALPGGIQITVSGWHPRNEALKIFCGSEVTFEDGSGRQFGCAPGNAWHCADGGNDCEAAKWIPSIPAK